MAKYIITCGDQEVGALEEGQKITIPCKGEIMMGDLVVEKEKEYFLSGTWQIQDLSRYSFPDYSVSQNFEYGANQVRSSGLTPNGMSPCYISNIYLRSTYVDKYSQTEDGIYNLDETISVSNGEFTRISCEVNAALKYYSSDVSDITSALTLEFVGSVKVSKEFYEAFTAVAHWDHETGGTN